MGPLTRQPRLIHRSQQVSVDVGEVGGQGPQNSTPTPAANTVSCM
jgi:hypothetical protein